MYDNNNNSVVQLNATLFLNIEGIEIMSSLFINKGQGVIFFRK